MTLIFAMCSFALSMSISPGPVNLVTLSSGINHGFLRTLPFVAGASIGFSLLLFLLGIALSLGLEVLPNMLVMGLQIAGAVFIAYMGFSLFRSASKEIELDTHKANQSAPGFAKGFLLQWLNPKAWIACLSGITAFNVTQSLTLLVVFTSLYLLICFVSIGCWAALGHKLQGLLNNPQYLKRFNQTMGISLMLLAGYLIVSLNNF